MKRNVVLFSLLGLGALYLLYEADEKHTSLDEVQIESVSATSDESETKIYHTRKLLSLENYPENNLKVDSPWTSTGNVFEDTNAQLQLLGKETAKIRNNKFNRRRKRHTPHPAQKFAWNFNLNVTRYDNNGTLNNKSTAYPTPSKDMKSKSDDRYLGMAMSVSGNGPDQSAQDLYKAWDSVGQFLRALFGGNLEDLKGNGHGVSVDVSSLPNGTLELSPDLFLEGSGEEESQESRNRRGKFLLGIFGFGGNKENPPRDEGSGDVSDFQEFNGTDSVEEIKFSNDTNEIKELSSTLENLSNDAISTVPSLISTENFKESLTSLVLDQTSSATRDTKISTEITSTSSITKEVFSVDKCTDCELQTESFASTDGKIPNEQNPTSHTLPPNVITTHFPLSDEALTDFCTTLFSRMRTSGRSVETSLNAEGSGSFEIDGTNIGDFSNVNTLASAVLTDKPRSQDLGFFESIWNRIVGRRVVSIKEGSLKESRGARLINFGNLFGGFGSGRSADSGEHSNIEFDNFNADLTDDIEDGEQFLSDCEEFFRSVQTDTRPNIFDLVNPHPVESLSTESTTQSTEIPQQIDETDGTTLKEALTISSISQPNNRIEDQTLSNLPDNQLTTQMQVKQLEENKGKDQFTETTPLENLVFTEVQGTARSDSLSIENLVMEKNTESQDVPTTEILNIPIITEIELTTKEANLSNLNEDRSLNVFGFGSGTVEGSADNAKERFFLGGLINLLGSGSREIEEIEISTEDNFETTESTKGRSLGLLFNFGSGERELKEIAISTEESSDKVTLASKERSFLVGDFGSGARELDDLSSSKFSDEDVPTSTITNEGRIFGLFFGSGERGLPEDADFTTGENETELLGYPSIEDITTRIPLITSSYPDEIPVQSVLPNTKDNLDEYEKGTIFTETNENAEETAFGLNIFGSGDSIELSNKFTDSEDINYTDNFTVVNPSTTNNYAEGEITSEYKLCVDCEVTNLPKMPEDVSVTVSPLDKMLSSTQGLSIDEDRTFESDLKDVTNMLQNPHSTKHEVSSSDAITEITLESTTVDNKSRFLGTIFLTGSGDSGLFVDNKGPINLVEESEFTSSPDFEQSFQSRRGARKHDIEFQKPKERIFEPTITTSFQSSSESNFITSQTPTDEIITIKTFVTEAVNETETNSVILGINDDIVKSVSIVQSLTPTVQPEIAEVTVTSMVTNITTRVPQFVTTINVMDSTAININPRSKITEPPQRFCTSASQCNRTLNERCIFDGPIAMCNCGRSYVRSPETGKCESPVVLKTSLKLPGELFHPDLMNRNSSRYRKMVNDSIETMWILLGDDPDLFRLVSGVSVSNFAEGSLVVHWEITLAAPENESVAQLIDQLDAELREAFQDEGLLKRAPLNVSDAVVMAVTNDIDPCEKSEHNYCSINADCIRDPIRSFKCRCKDDYLDQSPDLKHPGEICIETCPSNYCGDHGECNMKKIGEPRCSCNSWYFGEKCEISGIVVIAGFASFNVLLIIVVLFLVCYCRKRRYRQSRFYDENRVRFQPEPELGRFTASPRLADAIALGDVGPTKASKYMAVSTPLRPTPDIRLTSPSVLGGSATPYSKDPTNNYRMFARSSVDYDYDSTFDRTPSVEEINVEVHKSGTTPKA